MNFIHRLFIVLLLSGTLFSCSDWLYLEPEDGVIVDEYWNSEADLKAGVMGCYASLLGNNVSGSMSVSELMLLWGEIRADMLMQFTKPSNDYLLVWQGDIKSTNGFSRWGSFYRTINYCNNILERAPEIKKLDASLTEEQMNIYRGEAMAIRALMYFYLTRVFDEVPLMVESTKSDLQTITRGKATRQEVWDQIEADLLEAEKLVPFTYGRTKAEDKGRITKYAVWAMLADFYLWAEQYAKSEAASNKIIQSGRFWLMPGNMTWLSNLFVYGNSAEGIFELQFNYDILNPYYAMFKTNNQYRANPDVMEAFWPTDPYLVDPDSADIRADRGSFRAGANYTVWKYIGRDRVFEKMSSEATSNFIVYRYADVLLMKAEAIAAQLTSDDPQRAQEALSIIKTIRRRANASVLTDEGEPTNRNGLLIYILNERAREFAFEGKRWFDLLRYAKRDNYQQLQALKNIYQLSAPPEKLISIQNKLNDYNSHYLPLPQSDIDASNS
jgi:hypothetical protein